MTPGGETGGGPSLLAVRISCGQGIPRLASRIEPIQGARTKTATRCHGRVLRGFESQGNLKLFRFLGHIEEMAGVTGYSLVPCQQSHLGLLALLPCNSGVGTDTPMTAGPNSRPRLYW